MATATTKAPPRTRPAAPDYSLDLAGFRAAFSSVAKAAGGKTFNPILRSVLVELDGDGHATLSATDHEAGMVATIDGPTGCPPARFALPVDETTKVLRSVSATAGTLDLARDGDNLRIACNGSSWKMALPDAGTHPGVQAEVPEGAAVIDVDGEALAHAIRRTVFAADETSTRYALGGCHFSWTDGTLCLEATDGRRAAIQEVEAVTPGDSPAVDSRVVPIRVATMLASAFDGLGPVRLAFPSARRVVATGEGIAIVGQLAEGRFPRIRDAIPAGDPSARFVVAADAFRDAAGQAGALVSDESRRVDLRVADDAMTLASPDGESRSAPVPVAHDGDPTGVSHDVRYLLQVLSALKGEDVTIELFGSKEATMLLSGRFTCAQMPLTVEA